VSGSSLIIGFASAVSCAAARLAPKRTVKNEKQRMNEAKKPFLNKSGTFDQLTLLISKANVL
jgi:hypothetical protein